MSLHYYIKNEDNNKSESINNYKYFFESYESKLPTLSEALEQMFKSKNLDDEYVNELIKDIFDKCRKKINKNYDRINNKYKNISRDDAYIICAYTCESKKKVFSPYKILNKNLVSENREEGVENISKYLYIFLKTLRKLPIYYPNEEE